MRSHPMPRSMFAGAVLLLASCASVLEPIPQPPPGARPFDPPAKGADGKESLTCPDGRGASHAPACFYNGLGVTVDAMMKRRNEYAGLARQSIHDTAQFNALLPPAGAVVTYRRLREMPHSGLLLPAAVAAGFFGLMNSRIPEIHKHYLRAARELQCSTLRHAMWLYRTDEIVGDTDLMVFTHSTRDWVETAGIASSSDFTLRVSPMLTTGQRPQRFASASLQRLVSDLDAAVEAYGQARVRVMGGLQAPAAPAGAGDAFQRAKGKGGGTRQEDTRQRIRDFTLDRLNVAMALRDDLQRLLAEMEGANFRLQQEWSDIELDVQAGISDRLPPPQDPFVVGAAVKQQIAAFAQSGEATMVDRMDPTLPAELVSGVRDTGALRLFNETEAQRLFQAWQAAQRFKTAHDRRAELAWRTVEALRCVDRAPQVPAPSKPPAPPASAASSALPKAP